MNPFDFLNAINYTKEELIVDDLTEKEYLPYMVNRGLSYFPDSILMANEMNMASHIDHKLQFDFLLNIVRKRKRFSKWNKPDLHKDLESIKSYYNCSLDKAKTILSLLSADQLDQIKQKTSKGGKI